MKSQSNKINISTYGAPFASKNEENANPLIANIFCADPTAVEYEGRLYVYGTNDQQQYDAVGSDGSNTYEKIKSIVMLSTDDMVNWTYHGIIDVGEISVNEEAVEIAKGSGTKKGAEQIKNVDPYKVNQAETLFTASDISYVETEENGNMLISGNKGSWTYVSFYCSPKLSSRKKYSLIIIKEREYTPGGGR